MQYSTQNYWVSERWLSFGILNTNTTFRKKNLVPSSGEGRETSALLGRLERGNHNLYLCGVHPVLERTNFICIFI
jgi:hypothetical protein